MVVAKRRTAVWLAILVVVLDQVTKWIVIGAFPAGGGQAQITGFLNLVLTCNTGVSFGQLGGVPPWILIALALAICAGLLVWLRRQDRKVPILAIGLIVGGALGNIVDRLRIGCVVDFLDFHAFGWHWPAFNVADSAIVIGVVLLLVDGLFLDPDQSKREA